MTKGLPRAVGGTPAERKGKRSWGGRLPAGREGVKGSRTWEVGGR